MRLLPCGKHASYVDLCLSIDGLMKVVCSVNSEEVLGREAGGQTSAWSVLVSAWKVGCTVLWSSLTPSLRTTSFVKAEVLITLNRDS